jgi:hypothetical protein
MLSTQLSNDLVVELLLKAGADPNTVEYDEKNIPLTWDYEVNERIARLIKEAKQAKINLDNVKI